MKRVIFFIPLFLFANLDFFPCYQKFKYLKDTFQITTTKAITFSRPKKFIKYDPFTKMYVIYSNLKPIDFSLRPKLGWFLAAINYENVYGGTFAKDMLFLNPAKLSVTTPKNTIISDLFCRPYGVGRGDGFIKIEFIRHFVKYGYWGDIGIDVDKNMVIKYIDPFYVNKLKPNEKILRINGKKANIKTWSKYILLGKKGNRVKIKTNKHILILKIRKKIYNFTPLYYYGIQIDKQLNIIKVTKKFYNTFYITPPAKIVEINHKKISSFDELKKILSYHKHITITIKKEGIKFTFSPRM